MYWAKGLKFTPACKLVGRRLILDSFVLHPAQKGTVWRYYKPRVAAAIRIHEVPGNAEPESCSIQAAPFPRPLCSRIRDCCWEAGWETCGAGHLLRRGWLKKSQAPGLCWIHTSAWKCPAASVLSLEKNASGSGVQYAILCASKWPFLADLRRTDWIARENFSLLSHEFKICHLTSCRPDLHIAVHGCDFISSGVTAPWANSWLVALQLCSAYYSQVGKGSLFQWQ